MTSLILGYKYTGNFAWLNDVYQVLPNILWTIMAVVGAAGTVYAIVLGVNLAKGETEDKRKTAATRIKNTIIGVAVLILLVVFINVLLPLILHAAFPDFVKEVWLLIEKTCVLISTQVFLNTKKFKLSYKLV